MERLYEVKELIQGCENHIGGQNLIDIILYLNDIVEKHPKSYLKLDLDWDGSYYGMTICERILESDESYNKRLEAKEQKRKQKEKRIKAQIAKLNQELKAVEKEMEFK